MFQFIFTSPQTSCFQGILKKQIEAECLSLEYLPIKSLVTYLEFKDDGTNLSERQWFYALERISRKIQTKEDFQQIVNALQNLITHFCYRYDKLDIMSLYYFEAVIRFIDELLVKEFFPLTATNSISFSIQGLIDNTQEDQSFFQCYLNLLEQWCENSSHIISKQIDTLRSPYIFQHWFIILAKLKNTPLINAEKQALDNALLAFITPVCESFKKIATLLLTEDPPHKDFSEKLTHLKNLFNMRFTQNANLLLWRKATLFKIIDELLQNKTASPFQLLVAALIKGNPGNNIVELFTEWVKTAKDSPAFITSFRLIIMVQPEILWIADINENDLINILFPAPQLGNPDPDFLKKLFIITTQHPDALKKILSLGHNLTLRVISLTKPLISDKKEQFLPHNFFFNLFSTHLKSKEFSRESVIMLNDFFTLQSENSSLGAIITQHEKNKFASYFSLMRILYEALEERFQRQLYQFLLSEFKAPKEHANNIFTYIISHASDSEIDALLILLNVLPRTQTLDEICTSLLLEENENTFFVKKLDFIEKYFELLPVTKENCIIIHGYFDSKIEAFKQLQSLNFQAFKSFCLLLLNTLSELKMTKQKSYEFILRISKFDKNILPRLIEEAHSDTRKFIFDVFNDMFEIKQITSLNFFIDLLFKPASKKRASLAFTLQTGALPILNTLFNYSYLNPQIQKSFRAFINQAKNLKLQDDFTLNINFFDLMLTIISILPNDKKLPQEEIKNIIEDLKPLINNPTRNKLHHKKLSVFHHIRIETPFQFIKMTPLIANFFSIENESTSTEAFVLELIKELILPIYITDNLPKANFSRFLIEWNASEALLPNREIANKLRGHVSVRHSLSHSKLPYRYDLTQLPEEQQNTTPTPSQ